MFFLACCRSSAESRLSDKLCHWKELPCRMACWYCTRDCYENTHTHNVKANANGYNTLSGIQHCCLKWLCCNCPARQVRTPRQSVGTTETKLEQPGQTKVYTHTNTGNFPVLRGQEASSHAALQPGNDTSSNQACSQPDNGCASNVQSATRQSMDLCN